MAKYTALMMVVLLALAGANASRELKTSILDPITSTVTGTGGLLGAGLGAGNDGNGASNGGQDNGGAIIGSNVGSQTNNGIASQYQVCKDSCNGVVSVACCTTIGNIGNNNNVNVAQLCNGDVGGQCCLVPIKDITTAIGGGGIAGVGAAIPLNDLKAIAAVLGTSVDNSVTKRCA